MNDIPLSQYNICRAEMTVIQSEQDNNKKKSKILMENMSPDELRNKLKTSINYVHCCKCRQFNFCKEHSTDFPINEDTVLMCDMYKVRADPAGNSKWKRDRC
jgi:hypothetical protein